LNQKLIVNVLGPLEVLALGKQVLIRNRRLRTLLTVLALSSGEAVALADLIDTIWPSNPPSTAMHQIRKALSSIREILPDGWDSIRTTDTGYIILLGPAQSDLAAFRALASRAQTEMPRGEERADTLLAALRLWRGLPGRGDLDVGSRFVSEATRQWRAALADAVNVLTGLNRELEARQLIEKYAVLAGRDETTRDLTRQVSDAVVTRESEAARDVPDVQPPPLGTPQGYGVPGVAASPRAWRNALPPRDPLFSGRAKEVERIRRYLSAEERHIPPTVLIHGPVGAGKSALATEVAYRVLPSYPTGVFYLNAENNTADEPFTEAAAVTQLLLQTEGTWRDIPAEPAARVALWRGLLASQESLILIDNYAGDFDLRQILPNTARCASVITSRHAVLGVSPGLSCRINVMDDDENGDLGEHVLGRQPGEVRWDKCLREIITSSHGMPSLIRSACEVIKELGHGQFPDIPMIRGASNLTPAGGYCLEDQIAAAMRSLDDDSRRFLAILSLTPTPEYTYDLMIALTDGTSENADKIIARLVCESFLLVSEPANFELPWALYQYLREKRDDLVSSSHLTVAADRYRDFTGAKAGGPGIISVTCGKHVRSEDAGP
jgi:DNA-binding SARP family transcriptional activator